MTGRVVHVRYDRVMSTWEYKIIEATLREKEGTAALLNELGAQGWELVTVNPLMFSASFFVLKRPTA